MLSDLIQKGIAAIQPPMLRQYTTQAFSNMLLGKGPSFSLLQGSVLEPLAALQLESDGVVMPEGAWESGELLGCLTAIATSNPTSDDLPPPVDMSDDLLVEMTAPMESEHLRSTLEALHAFRDSTLPVCDVIRLLVQIAQLDGPLKLLGGPPNTCDLPTFSQHLSALASQLNKLHDPELMGGFLRSPYFKRTKYELFALQHMQLLVWLYRVQQGLLQGVGKTGNELVTFVASIGHAARVLLFQPMLLHGLQVVRAVQSLPTEEVEGSMREAMTYPPDTATDADRVEWLQLNLQLQFQSVYRDALCNPQIYQLQYSPGEANLFQQVLRLEEIYTHLLGRFPSCCPLSDQEQAFLTHICEKLSKFFQEGKQIKTVLEQQPQQGKQLLVANGLATSAQFAVRDWILPHMMHFTDLLKVLWTLWKQQKQKRRMLEAQQRSLEEIARLAGTCIVQQLTEEEAALRAHQAASRPAEPPKEAALWRSGAEVEAPPQALPTAARGVAAPPMENNGHPLDVGAGGWASVVRRAPVEVPIATGTASASAVKAAAKAPIANKQLSVGGAGVGGEEQVRALVTKRESARFARDFDSADKLREQLQRLGVTLDDQNKVWRSNDGRLSGPIIGVNVSELQAQKAAKAGAAPLADDEIDRLVKEREQARFTSDYKTADRLRDQLEKHGVHLDTKENKWHSSDGRSGAIGPVNISAAHAQKAARAGAPRLSEDDIQKIIVNREQARARRDYKTADVLRDQLEKHGVYLDTKENKWRASDGRMGAIVMSSLSDEEVGKILASRQAARLRHDYKTADRLRDQLNEQCVSVDDKKNRWDASDGRSGAIEPFTCVHATAPAPDAPAPAPAPKAEEGAASASAPPPVAGGNSGGGGGGGAKGESKRLLPEKERREKAKKLRDFTGASARLCEKALQSHGDDMDRAAEWLLSKSSGSGGDDLSGGGGDDL